MTERFQCGESVALVGYLYEECSPDDLEAIRAHVEVCAACAAELMALESTRSQLASWTPPDAKLGFMLDGARPEESAAPLRRGLGMAAWLRQPLPAWANVAAAAGIFAAGLSLGLLRGSDSAVTQPVAVEASASSARAVSAPAVSPLELAALEARLREEIAGIRTAAARSAAPASSPSETQLLARVQVLIDESEERQRRELALRTAEVVREFDSQRRMDLAQIQRTFGQIEGVTGAEVRQQRQMLNYLMQVSQQR